MSKRIDSNGYSRLCGHNYILDLTEHSSTCLVCNSGHGKHIAVLDISGVQAHCLICDSCQKKLEK